MNETAAAPQKKVEMIEHPTEVDDREEEVEIVYGERAQTYIRERLPKRAGFERLYSYYVGTAMKMVPKNDVNGQAVNTATVYMKFRRRDPHSGKEIVSYRDLPLWIAVDRALNRGYHIELVTKQEHDKFFADKQLPEDQLTAHLAEERKKGNLQQPVMNRN